MLDYDDNPKKIIHNKISKKAYKTAFDQHNKFSESKSYYNHPKNPESIRSIKRTKYNASGREEIDHYIP